MQFHFIGSKKIISEDVKKVQLTNSGHGYNSKI